MGDLFPAELSEATAHAKARRAMARRSDPPTSHAAAEKASQLQHKHWRLIAAVLWLHGPRSKDGIAKLTGEPGKQARLTGVQVARRLPEMEAAGYVEQTGRLVKSNTGRAEREWCLTQKARVFR